MGAITSGWVLSLKPDLIFSNGAAGPADAMSQLVASGIPIVFVDSTPSPDAIIGRTQFLAKVVNREQAGTQLAQDIQQKFSALKGWRDTQGA